VQGAGPYPFGTLTNSLHLRTEAKHSTIEAGPLQAVSADWNGFNLFKRSLRVKQHFASLYVTQLTEAFPIIRGLDA
jgi:hypothetical protein